MKVDNVTIQPNVNLSFLSDKSTETNITYPIKSDKVELSQKKSKNKNAWKCFLSTLAVVGAGVGIYFICRKKPPKINVEPPVKPPVEPPVIEPHVEPAFIKPHWQEYNELKAESDKFYNEFIAMDRNSDRSDAKEKMRKASIAVRDYMEKAKKENFSLLEKKDLSSASEDERLEYFIKYAFPLMENNEATALDCIEMFDKFGMRKYIELFPNDALLHTSLGKLMMHTPDEPSDNLISKLFDVIDKYTIPNTATDFDDVDMLRFILIHSKRYHLDKNISEDSLLKAINLFKKMEFWNTKPENIPNEIKMRYIDRKFKDSPRLNEIKDAVEDLRILWNANNPDKINYSFL